VLAGPLTGEEGILYAEIDAGQARAARQQFDPVGHYGRSDVLRLHVDTSPRPAVIETPGPSLTQAPAAPPEAATAQTSQ
jgi:nitrilase